MEIVRAAETASLYRRFWPAFQAYVDGLIERSWLDASFGPETSCGPGTCDAARLSVALRQELGTVGWPVNRPGDLSPTDIQAILTFFSRSVAIPHLEQCAHCFSRFGVYHTMIASADPEAARSYYNATVNEQLSRFEQSFRLGTDGIVEAGSIDAPLLPNSWETVRLAITEAESALRRGSPQSAVDRLHTALHGFLRCVSDDSSLGATPNASITELYKLVRTRYLEGTPEMKPVLNALSALVSALNEIRNSSSLAHPGDLLEPAEAELFANAAKTILTYLTKRVPTGLSGSK